MELTCCQKLKLKQTVRIRRLRILITNDMLATHGGDNIQKACIDKYPESNERVCSECIIPDDGYSEDSLSDEWSGDDQVEDKCAVCDLPACPCMNYNCERCESIFCYSCFHNTNLPTMDKCSICRRNGCYFCQQECHHCGQIICNTGSCKFSCVCDVIVRRRYTI